MSHRRQVQVIDRPAPVTSDGTPPEGLRQHVIDRQPWHPEGAPASGGPLPDRTVCGEPWDVAERKVKAPFCEKCRAILRARGEEHYIDQLLRGAP